MTQNVIFKTRLLESDKRRRAGIRNYILKNLEFYDGLRDVFELYNPITSGSEKLLIELAAPQKQTWLQRMKYKYVARGEKPSLQLYNHWANSLLFRLRSYIGSVEFTHRKFE
jgi:hypothetical protein